MSIETPARHYAEQHLDTCIRTFLEEAGASAQDAAATTRALLHASRLGIDSHGVRLAPHYGTLLRSGGINPSPNRLYFQTGPATGRLDGDGGLAHATSYRAMTEAVALAAESGIGAIGVSRSTHFGAAGAYALTAAEQGMIGIVTSNSDAAVTLFGGAGPFHGTNPIAMAAPVPHAAPWLLDIATSSIPFNRVKLSRALGRDLPPDAAVDASGHSTCNATQAATLQPLGGEAFGFKGAALAGLVTILSAIMTGADPDPIMTGTDAPQTARSRQNVGHFVIAIDPGRFTTRATYDSTMQHYLNLLRASHAIDARHPVFAPGDREWQEAARRKADGIPVDLQTCAQLGLT